MSRGERGFASWPARVARFLRWLAEREALPAEPPPKHRGRRGWRTGLLRRESLPSAPAGKPRARASGGGLAWLLALERLPEPSAGPEVGDRPPGFLAWLLARETLPTDIDDVKGEANEHGR